MAESFTLTGTLSDGRVILLDQPLPVETAKVRVEVHITPSPATESLTDFLDRIWAEQRQLGRPRRTKEEIDEYLRQERAGWDDPR